jgi:hypothetical protein
VKSEEEDKEEETANADWMRPLEIGAGSCEVTAVHVNEEDTQNQPEELCF